MKNRVIKFRVWDESNKYWLNEWIGINNFGVVVNDRENMDDLSLRDGVIIQQYTGLKDKNGKEIYEGDIINGYLILENDEDFSFKGGIVEYEGCGFWCNKADFPLDQYNEFEIVGNIFENTKSVNNQQLI